MRKLGLENLQFHRTFPGAVTREHLGDTVHIFNTRGACIAAARLTGALMPGLATLPTGAWFCVPGWGTNEPEQNGNPNAVTHDIGTSSLAQGPTAQNCMVEIGPWSDH